MNIDLKSFHLLAQGGQSDIYEFENDKIIRVPRRFEDHERIQYEFNVYRSLTGCEIDIPEVFELIEIDNVPCIIMEKLSGVSMLDSIRNCPFTIFKKTIDLVKLHLGVLSLKAADTIYSEKDRARKCILLNDMLDENSRQIALGILDELPDGNSLCHGDFHPGNIINHNGKYFIIDWSAASRGDYLSDIAHTYILLKVVPRIPQIGIVFHFIQKILGNMILKKYIKTIFKLKSFDWVCFSKWIFIKAIERSIFGLPSEKEQLIKFVSRFIKSYKDKSNSNKLYKML
jgi:uncharacterized protein (TIGR02172 family)